MKIERMIVVLICTALLAALAPARAQEEKERIPIKPALLVIDVQNQWMPMMAAEDREAAPDSINAAIAMFREHGYPVICVYHTDPARGPEPGTEPFEFAEIFVVSDSDARVIKNHPSSFTKTDLEKMLREGGRNTVFLCGLSATGCVLATYYGGLEREFYCFMVEDALLSGNAEYTDVIEDICYSVSLEELRGVMEEPYFE